MSETTKINLEDNTKNCPQTTNTKEFEDIMDEYNIVEKTIDKNVKKKRKNKKRKLKTDKNSSLLEPSEKKGRKHPNYYIAVAISDPAICEAVEKMQLFLSIADIRLKQAIVPIRTLHVTLMVLTLDEDAYIRVKKALSNAHEEINSSMCEKPLNLEFRGVGHFNHRVLYAKMCHNESYERFVAFMEVIKLHLEKEKVLTSIKEEEFTPHMTMMKLRMSSKVHRLVKKINPALYESHKNEYFGIQIVDGFRLIKMDGRIDPVTGRLVADEFIFQKEE